MNIKGNNKYTNSGEDTLTVELKKTLGINEDDLRNQGYVSEEEMNLMLLNYLKTLNIPDMWEYYKKSQRRLAAHVRCKIYGSNRKGFRYYYIPEITEFFQYI